MAVLGIVSCYVGGLAASMGRPVFQFTVGVKHIQIMPVGRFDVTWIFLQGKRPAGFQIHAGLFSEPEGLSPDGGLFYSTDKESTPDRRAARPVAERR